MPETSSGLIREGFHQVSWVVRDIKAAERFFTERMGVPRFFHIDDLGADTTEGMYRGRPGDFRAHYYLGYAGETQLELVQHLSGRSIFQEFLERHGEGVHHVAYLVPDFGRAEKDLTAKGFPLIQSFRPPGSDPTSRVGYFDTEGAIGVTTEIITLDEGGRKLFETIKRGDF